jgi:c-di-GMP-related signal transduction protein
VDSSSRGKSPLELERLKLCLTRADEADMKAASSEIETARKSNTAHSQEVSHDARFVARQPIFDLRTRVHGYELLFRSGPTTAFSGDGDTATRLMLDNTVLFGMEQLAGSALSFVNCTREALVSQLVEVLPPNLAVLEILEFLEPEPVLIQALKKLKARGFRLALDDFAWRPELLPFVELADYIKVDFMQSGRRERAELKRRLGGRPLAMIAEKVETLDDYHIACEEGFSFFQGYYFCRPTLIENRAVPRNRITQLELLVALQESQYDVPRITQMVMRDPAITYRLLRLINSSVYAVQKEIRSVKAALITVGEKAFRNIVTLAITSELNAGGTAEVLRMAFVRARFCERASEVFNLDPNEQYLVGMFSLLPAMLNVSMEKILAALPLRNEIRAALMGEQAPERCPLAWMEAMEQGNWKHCDDIAERNDLDQRLLLEIAEEARKWAQSTLSFAGGIPSNGKHPAR